MFDEKAGEVGLAGSWSRGNYYGHTIGLAWGDLDGDGQSEYILGVIEYLDKETTIYGDYRNHFYIFDSNMNLKQYIIFDDKRAAMPYSFYWMKVNGKLRPA